MIKHCLIVVILFALFSCSSVKRIEKSCEKNPFQELDSTQRANQNLRYTIQTPKSWKNGKTSDGDSYALDGKFIDSLGYFSRPASVYVSRNAIRETCNDKVFSIEDYLHYYVDFKNRWYSDTTFKYLLLKGKHKFYKAIYIINYSNKTADSRLFKYTTFLFFKENIGYSLTYVSEPKHYETHLPEVEKMINSFRILE